MGEVNNVAIVGNLAADPEKIGSGEKIGCRFPVAQNYEYGPDRQEGHDYFDVELWGTQAERCQAELSKGDRVLVLGRLAQDRWENEEGNTRSKVKIRGRAVGLSLEFKAKEDDNLTAEGNGDNSEE